MRPFTSRAAGVAAAVLLILAWTLGSGGGGEPPVAFAGRRWLADLLGNLLLFMPLGAALGHAGLRLPRALLGAGLLAALVEAAQLAIAGRDASALDVASNAAGAAAGWLLAAHAAAWLRPGPETGRRLARWALLAALLLLAAPFALLRWSVTDSSYVVRWTPAMHRLERYRGRVIEATVLDQPLLDGLARHSPTLAWQLRTGARLAVVFEAGPPPRRLAPIFTVLDHQQREILLLGAHGHDFVWRHRTAAAVAGLDAPSFRVADALRDIAPGSRVRVAITRVERGSCIRVNLLETCGVGPSVAQGWALVYYPDALPAPLETLLGFAWLAGVVLPFAWWAAPRRAAAGAAVVASLLWLAPVVALAPPSRPLDWLAAATGIGLGQLLRRRLARAASAGTPSL